MANKSLFKSIAGKLLPKADAANEAGGVAYALPPKAALAQYAATGCLNSTFYASAGEQLGEVLALCERVEPEFIARTALYCRRKGHMKDLPALLCAVLSVKSPGLLAEIFDRVIDNGRMLRTFVQIMRSGAVGRRSLGTLPKRLIVQWLECRSDEQLFRASVGNDPSLADIVKMVHPRPATASRAALYGSLIGREFDAAALPELVKAYEAFKASVDGDEPVPDVPLEMLAGLTLTRRQWGQIAVKSPWQATRMNLNTFARHRAFDVPGVAAAVAGKLRDPSLIAKARVFPYQLMAAYAMTDQGVPAEVREALQDAMEIAIGNVPAVDGKVWIFPDISGSMQSSVTGHRKGATSAVRCVDIAALVAAAVLRKNPRAGVVPFESEAVEVSLNPRDSVMTNAQKLCSLPAGGTNCSAPLALLNRRKEIGDLVVYVSDNESWIDTPVHGRFGGSATRTMEEWALFKRRNPRARMVCLDIQPYATTQAAERDDILNIGGFSDAVFGVIAEFAAGRLGNEHWVGVIQKEVL